MELKPAVPGKTGARRVLRLGSVSYLNAKPLIYGLETAEDLRLLLDVPSRLLDGLRQNRFDVALLPVIDYQRMDGLCVLPCSCIGCDGPTLTVRIFSQVPLGQIECLACDTDSHTSVALARVVLAEHYGIRPRFTDRAGGDPPSGQAVLLIGDKVVCEEPPGFEHQLDLGAAWKQMTGLPFVFAVWMARPGVQLRDVSRQLKQAKQDGLLHIPQIITQYALHRGWPAGLALQYMTVYLNYELGEKQLEAIRLFHRLAARYGLIGPELRPLEVVQDQW